MVKINFLGISMARRSRRRALVVTVYVLLIAMIFFVLFRRGGRLLQPGDFLGGINLVFVIVFTGISRLAFGAVVKQSTMPLPDVDNPDERQLSVRNRAHFYGLRLVAVYLILLWIVCLVLNAQGTTSISLNGLGLLLFPSLVLVLTFPQAWILWTDPDLPTQDHDYEFTSKHSPGHAGFHR